MLYDPAAGRVEPTPNLTTLQRAVAALRDAGRTEIEVNAPGTTSVATLQAARRCRSDSGRTGSRAHRDDAVARVRRSRRGAGDRLRLRGLAPRRRRGVRVRRRALRRPGARRRSRVRPRLHQTPMPALPVPTTLPVEMPAAEAIDYYCVVDTSGGPPLSVGYDGHLRVPPAGLRHPWTHRRRSPVSPRDPPRCWASGARTVAVPRTDSAGRR